MHIIHGTWIPDNVHDFIQSGAFCLWVETDTPLDVSSHCVDAIHPRHLDIHQCHVRLVFFEHLHGLNAIARLAHDEHPLLRLDDGGQPAADHRVIVHDQNADFIGTKSHTQAEFIPD